MTDLFPTVLAASTVKSIGAVIAVLTVIGFIWYIAANVRAGRAEVASEIELAPNRKAYYDDEGLEGPRLTSALSTGLILLAVCAIGLPLYWLAEPSRMDGAIAQFDSVFVSRGSKLFAPTEEGGYNCAGCHGGMEAQGGVAPPFTLTGADGEFDATVAWQAPALNTVLLRFSEAEVEDILVYGRPGTPMPAWGAAGGGPLTTQQIDELVAYLGSIQITPEEARVQIEAGIRKEMGLAENAKINYRDPAVGAALFTLGLGDGPSSGVVAGGAFGCARCHTKGASLMPGTELPAGADLSEHAGFPQGSGALGPSLRYSLVPRQFLTAADLADFIRKGSVNAMLYGQRGQGSGRMPGFGDNPNTPDVDGDGMYSDEMVLAVAIYEANLHLDGTDDADPVGSEPLTVNDATTTTTTSTTAPEDAE